MTPLAAPQGVTARWTITGFNDAGIIIANAADAQAGTGGWYRTSGQEWLGPESIFGALSVAGLAVGGSANSGVFSFNGASTTLPLPTPYQGIPYRLEACIITFENWGIAALRCGVNSSGTIVGTALRSPYASLQQFDAECPSLYAAAWPTHCLDVTQGVLWPVGGAPVVLTFPLVSIPATAADGTPTQLPVNESAAHDVSDNGIVVGQLGAELVYPLLGGRGYPPPLGGRISSVPAVWRSGSWAILPTVGGNGTATAISRDGRFILGEDCAQIGPCSWVVWFNPDAGGASGWSIAQTYGVFPLPGQANDAQLTDRGWVLFDTDDGVGNKVPVVAIPVVTGSAARYAEDWVVSNDAIHGAMNKRGQEAGTSADGTTLLLFTPMPQLGSIINADYRSPNGYGLSFTSCAPCAPTPLLKGAPENVLNIVVLYPASIDPSTVTLTVLDSSARNGRLKVGPPQTKLDLRPPEALLEDTVVVPAQDTSRWLMKMDADDVMWKDWALTITAFASAKDIEGNQTPGDTLSLTQDSIDTQRQEFEDWRLPFITPPRSAFRSDWSTAHFSSAQLEPGPGFPPTTFGVGAGADYPDYLADARMLTGVEAWLQTSISRRPLLSAYAGFTITGGYRNPVHHFLHIPGKVKARDSQHLHGNAIDAWTDPHTLWPAGSLSPLGMQFATWEFLDYAASVIGACREPLAKVISPNGIISHAHADWRDLSVCPSNWQAASSYTP